MEGGNLTSRPSDPTQSSMSFVFRANRQRQDHWAELHRLSGSLARAQQVRKAQIGKQSEQVESLLREMAIVEEYWAYPGETLMDALREKVATADYVGLAKAVDSIARNLRSQAYRRNPGAWELSDEATDRELVGIPDVRTSLDTAPPFFELLVVSGYDTDIEHVRHELLALRRDDDPFVYEAVRVPSYEDAVAATLINYQLEAVLIIEGFPFGSPHGFSAGGEFLKRYVEVAEDELEVEDYALSLADVIHRLRPELDIFVLTERLAEDLAKQDIGANVSRIFYSTEEFMELHLSILQGVGRRYETPFFSNLKEYAKRPVGTFHALPVARGKSVFRSHWIRDMGHFYGLNLFLAESSATSGGLDSLLEPTGTIKEAQRNAARCFGAERSYFVTNGTSTANKIVVQAVCQPGDIVLVDRNCHKSHHYGMVLCGAQPLYLDAYPLVPYSMYGGVPLSTIKRTLLELKAENKLDRVRMLLLTNCTFDGHVYNTRRVMEECLAIKPDLIFLWDEAWFAYARFSPFLRPRTSMGAAEFLHRRYRESAYADEYSKFRDEIGEISLDNAKAMEMRLMPDPDTVRIRAYATQSTHKSLSALRQGSMIHVRDEDFEDRVEEAFEEAFMTHTSTSPNQQIIASLDIARRQAELEGFELVSKQIVLALELREHVNSDARLSRYFRFLTPAEMIPADFRETGLENYQGEDPWRAAFEAVERDEFFLDPTRLTLMCGTAGYDGTEFKNELADNWDIQINKTSRNTVLFQSNINNTRSATSYLIETLAKIGRDIDENQSHAGASHRQAFESRVRALIEDVPDLPDFSHFHAAFREDPNSATREGRIRDAYFMAYNRENCEHVPLADAEIDRRLAEGPEMVSANFVIPYPPGFPIMVPGQVITAEIIEFMRKLDVKEIHGYHADVGLKLIRPERLNASLGGAR